MTKPSYTQDIVRRLKNSGFKLTPQRLAVIEFLRRNTTHPSAETIFQAVKKLHPMISFSTVYNTLKMLEKIGSIQQLAIAEEHINIDPNPNPHHHLLCEKCGKIIDIADNPDWNPEIPEGFEVKKIRVYLYGTCSDCQASRLQKDLNQEEDRA